MTQFQKPAPQSQSAQRQKWDLVKVMSGSGMDPQYNVAIHYMADGKYVPIELKRDKSKGDKDDFDAKNRFVAKLLSEGWEPLNGSVAYGAGQRIDALYFRRMA